MRATFNGDAIVLLLNKITAVRLAEALQDHARSEKYLDQQDVMRRTAQHLTEAVGAAEVYEHRRIAEKYAGEG